MPKDPATAPSAIKQSRVRRSPEVTVEDENEWRRGAEVAMTALARRGQPFTSMDLVKIVGPPPTASLLPSIVRAAHLSKVIQKSDTAPVGTVWVGVNPDPKSSRRGAGRRKTDESQLSGELLLSAHERALKEKVPTGEVLTRALRAYLQKS